MEEPFTFEWGARSLAGLGVHLEAGQVALTEQKASALVVMPLFDPLCEEPYKMHNGSEPLVGPVLLDVELNHPIQKNLDGSDYMLQDEIDSWTGEEWREFAKVVGDAQWGATPPCCIYTMENMRIPVWDAVLLTPEQAARMGPQIQNIWESTAYPAMEHWRHLADEADYYGEGRLMEDEFLVEGWQQICEDLKLDPKLEPREQVFDWDKLNLNPQWVFDDADLNRKWARLKKSSQRSWQAMDTLHVGDKTSNWRWQTYEENPWS